ncbi:MAG: CinA family protein [Burkholderiales bacterium]
MSETVRVLAQRAGEALGRQGLRLVTAESCTGGGIAVAVTDIPGSSGWLDRGFVVYSNDSKVELLGVDPGVLRLEGAVSEAVVRAMTAGALSHSAADIAVAVSGIAGPGGGSPEKPVGTVCLAWQRRGQAPLAQTLLFHGNRDAVRAATVRRALEGVLQMLHA